jgi:4-oxalocrotonate tautomerase
MPLIQISFVEGRDPVSVNACVKAVARTVHETLGAPLSSIRVIATAVPASYWAVGDQTRNELDALKSTEKLALEEGGQ